MAAKNNGQEKPEPDDCEPCFEESLAELEAIVHALEDGQLGLTESLARYEAGVKRLRHCFQLLQQAERKIELLTRVDAAGNAVTQPFAGEEVSLPEQAGTRRRRKASPAPPPSAGEPGDAVDAEPGLF